MHMSPAQVHTRAGVSCLTTTTTTTTTGASTAHHVCLFIYLIHGW
jgi:hypothetical protein